MSLLKHKRPMKLLLLSSVLSMIVGCSSVPTEQRYTNVRPKAEPLSVEVLQAMQPDSTRLLKKADLWFENSGTLLDSVTDN